MHCCNDQWNQFLSNRRFELREAKLKRWFTCYDREKENVMASRLHNESEAGNKASAVVKDLQDVGAAAKRAASDGADVVRETASQVLDQGRAKAIEVGETVGAQVRDQPVKSVLIAAGLGFVLGMLWIRR
jgi:ElaB/YqjD/DUF883 family membrane-anchored ribosome-binding protein